MAKHNLIEISRERSSDGMVDTVVRWCASCGAIVVDGESDERLSPGHFMPMRRPAQTKHVACGEEALAHPAPVAVPEVNGQHGEVFGKSAVPEGYALVRKWREQANAALRRSGTWNGNDMADRIDGMADELAAMLAAANKESNNG